MHNSVRTRFAPSPTGYLHIGGARTALFSWLYARHCGGQFILRIEDTDLERSTKESIDAILQAMEWLNLDYDEGPFYQTQHFPRYLAVADQLVLEGKAYRCYCTKERLETLRNTQQENKEKPRYDGHCRELTTEKEGPFVIRFKNPKEGVVSFQDLIRGEIVVANQELDDLIIVRSDGAPTYNFTVVIDDWDMKITQVIRGDDHINNTPRQINIFKALNAQAPRYAHVPMILGDDGKRLSKRHGAVSVMEFAKAGILPEAMLNCLVRLGWSHGDQEIFNRTEMIEFFDLDHVSHSAAAFTAEKLLWYNQQWMKSIDPKLLIPPFKEQLQALGITVDRDILDTVILNQVERVKTLKEMAERSRYFFEDTISYDEEAVRKNITPEIQPVLQAVYAAFAALVDWQREALHAIILEIAEKNGLKLGKIAQPIRVVVTGGTMSPSLDVTLELIGKEWVLARLRKWV